MARILVAEDDPLVLDALNDLLVKLGHTVMTAIDGDQAYRCCHRFRPDILISDMKMPGIDGISLQQKVKVAHPACRAILITGYASPETLQDAMEGGVDACISKPFSIQQIQEQIETFLLEQETLRQPDPPSEDAHPNPRKLPVRSILLWLVMILLIFLAIYQGRMISQQEAVIQNLEEQLQALLAR